MSERLTNPAYARRTLLLGGVASCLLTPGGVSFAQASSPEDRLTSLDLKLPQVTQPIANFVQSSREGQLIYVSGQLPIQDGKILHPGRVGVDVTPEQAKDAARICALNVLAVAKAACEGDLGRIRRCMRLDGFVASDPSFTSQPAVINGASDLIVAVLADAGRHARFAVGVVSLPLNAAVEVAAIFSIS